MGGKAPDCLRGGAGAFGFGAATGAVTTGVGLGGAWY